MIDIEGKKINKKSEPYIICETGINHNGNLNNAYKMIEIAKESGADAVKFQTYKTIEFCNKNSELYNTFKQCEFKNDDWKLIKEKCDQVEITFLSTPQNYSDFETLQELGIKAIKVGSDDLNNLPLLEKYSLSGLPIILSCGMAYWKEIEDALKTIRIINQNYPIILMHCTSLYPVEPMEVNIRKLRKLSRSKAILGYSDHTYGSCAAVLAVAFGAKVFETHFTLNHSMDGPDHKFSKDPYELKAWVKDIRQADIMLGSYDIVPTAKEEHMRILARRSLTALSDIKKDEIFTDKNIGIMRPSDGLPPIYLKYFLNSVSTRDITSGEKMQEGDIEL